MRQIITQDYLMLLSTIKDMEQLAVLEKNALILQILNKALLQLNQLVSCLLY